MDSFTEQIIAKTPEVKDIAKRMFIYSTGAILFIIFMSLAIMMIPLAMIFVALAVCSIWLARVLAHSTYIEYEYIVTNNEMDIDKILAKKKRKRLITIKINKAEEWGEYSEGKGAASAVTVQAHDCTLEGLWYLVTHHEKYGRTTVLFSPNNSVLQTINKYVPPSIRKRELAERAPHEDNNETED